MGIDIWQDPRTINWAKDRPFLLSRDGVTCVVEGVIALRHSFNRATLDLTTRKSNPRIKEGSLENEDAVRKYIEHNPEDPNKLVTLNFRLAERASIIVGGYRITRDGVTEGGLHLGVAAAHEATIWEVRGNFDPEHFLRRSRRFRG